MPVIQAVFGFPTVEYETCLLILVKMLLADGGRSRERLSIAGLNEPDVFQVNFVKSALYFIWIVIEAGLLNRSAPYLQNLHCRG